MISDDPKEKLLEELATDRYGYDLRNWRVSGITEDEVRRRYNNDGDGFPNASASRFFELVLPTLKEKHNVPTEDIVNIIMSNKEGNLRKLKRGWIESVRWHYQHGDDEREHPRPSSHELYAHVCEALGEKPMSMARIIKGTKKLAELFPPSYLPKLGQAELNDPSAKRCADCERRIASKYLRCYDCYMKRKNNGESVRCMT